MRLVNDYRANSAETALTKPVDHRAVSDVDEFARLVMVAVSRHLITNRIARTDAASAGHHAPNEGGDPYRGLNAWLRDNDWAKIRQFSEWRPDAYARQGG
ncbi:hypothetical protein D9M72_339620 [compost metagenome]